MNLYTIDPYTNTVQYNESLQALRNNNVQFSQFISLRAPYHWYLELPSDPLLVNYDKLDAKELKYVVTAVKPINPSSEFELLRREANGVPVKYFENIPLKEARESKYALFFNATGIDQLKQMSKNLPGHKIYYFGKFLNNRFRLALCMSPMALNFAPANSILLEKKNSSNLFNNPRGIGGSLGSQGDQANDYSKPGFFEADLNRRVFKFKDFLVKYSDTPYFLDGKYYPVKYQGTYSDPNKTRFTF